MKKSNLNEVKEVAKSFLFLPIEESSRFGKLVIHHPFFQSCATMINVDGEYKLVDIVDDKNALEQAQKEMLHQIDLMDSVSMVMFMINKPYKLVFLKYIKRYLSKEDFSKLLADAWTITEKPSSDQNVSISTFIKWFESCDKKHLMDKDDYNFYNNLADEIVIYRGVCGTKNYKKGISWTLNKETAEFFSRRWSADSDGYILSGIAKKEDVLAFFNSRNEQEIIINPSKIKEVVRCDL